MAIYHIYHIFERGGVLAIYHIYHNYLKGGVWLIYHSLSHRGGGSLGGPKNYDVIFAQPLILPPSPTPAKFTSSVLGKLKASSYIIY